MCIRDSFLQHWIFGLPSAQPFTQVLSSDLWYLTQEIPVRSRVEYKLEVQRGDVSRLIRDPLNSQLAHDPFGANSVCQGAEYQIPDLVAPDPEARPGTLEKLRLASSALDGTQEADADHVNVTWTFHPDDGLQAVFTATD